MTPSELIAERMMAALDKPNAARLQATVIAIACMGVYSPPFGKAIDADALIATTDCIEALGCFPLKTIGECVSSFEAALIAHSVYTNERAK